MEGFEVIIHSSLTQPIMLIGVPREIAILNGTLTAALVLGMHSPLGVPVGLSLHLVFVAISRRDPQFFQTFRRQLKHKTYYSE